MASFPSTRQLVSARWVFLMLISCLALHFLIEDSLMLSACASINAQFSEQQRYEEDTHQDDLAAPVHLPERITRCDLPVVFSLTVPFRKPASSPILSPPKTA
jgi:hypothetical protein